MQDLAHCQLTSEHAFEIIDVEERLQCVRELNALVTKRARAIATWFTENPLAQLEEIEEGELWPVVAEQLKTRSRQNDATGSRRLVGVEGSPTTRLQRLAD